ncbi:MAG: PTS sugar transporter subunit IIA [Treponema sp.]|jgi:PTS system fructose-specific IIC component/PTS system nitrogen regulatory IIA component|nr:PTS sugar transporter subunit IIA [Treponema sp.]
MILQDILLPEFIKVNIEAEDKDNAFEELVSYYCKADKSKSYNEILDAIVTREAKMSTGIHRGVAVPHGKTTAVKKLRGVLGISQKGVQYDALDGEPVYLLFMIISPVEDSGDHLRLLKHLSALVEIPQFKTELQAQKDAQSAFNVIQKFEEMFFAEDVVL